MALAVLGGDAECVSAAAMREPGGKLRDRRRRRQSDISETLRNPLIMAIGQAAGAGARRVGQGCVSRRLVLPQPRGAGTAARQLLRDAIRRAAAVAGIVAENLERLAGRDAALARHVVRLDAAALALGPALLDRLDLATSTCQWWAQRPVLGLGRRGLLPRHLRRTCGTTSTRWPGSSRDWNARSARCRTSIPRPASSRRPAWSASAARAGSMWAGDSQRGTVLKAYREHQMSADDEFLKRNWPRIRKALEFLIQRGRQRRRADRRRAAQHLRHQLLRPEHDGRLALPGRACGPARRWPASWATTRVRRHAAARSSRRGSRLSVERLFNGEYFIQKVDLAAASQAPVRRRLPGRSALRPRLGAPGRAWATSIRRTRSLRR